MSKDSAVVYLLDTARGWLGGMYGQMGSDSVRGGGRRCAMRCAVLFCVVPVRMCGTVEHFESTRYYKRVNKSPLFCSPPPSSFLARLHLHSSSSPSPPGLLLYLLPSKQSCYSVLKHPLLFCPLLLASPSFSRPQPFPLLLILHRADLSSNIGLE